MSANVSTAYSGNGVVPWYGMMPGVTVVEGLLKSEDAIKAASLNWFAVPEPIYDKDGRELPGYRVNVRSTDRMILGVTTDKYKIIQNHEAFAFTDELLGHGVWYETAGFLHNGTVWLMARMEDTLLAEENISPYLVFVNSHNGKGAVRVAIVSVRVVCQNTLNMALSTAQRHWSCSHIGNIEDKLEEARYTLSNTKLYMEALEEEFGELKLKHVSEAKVREMTDTLLKVEYESLYKKAIKDSSVIDLRQYLEQQKYEEKLNKKRNDILDIYYDKPDLRETEHTAFRFVNAVSDYVGHNTDHRNTKNYQQNLFAKLVDGHSTIDVAHKIAQAA